MKVSITPLILILWLVLLTGHVHAGGASYLVRETTEFVVKKFGKETAEQGTEVLTRRIGTLAQRYGDNVFAAFRKVGPKVSRLADDAGQHAPAALRVLAKHGDDAVRLVMRPKQLGLVASLGDDAAECLLKHGEAVEPLLHTLGTPAAKALQNVSTQNGRRLSMMLADGQLSKLGKADELLGVVSRYGDNAANFVWKNKGALAVGAGLTAFLATPETFINGGTELTSIVADAAVQPVMAAAAESVPWGGLATMASIAGGIVLVLWLAPYLFAGKADDPRTVRPANSSNAKTKERTN